MPAAFSLAVKARRANVPPAIEHDCSPSLLGFYLECDDISPPAFVANWSDHAQDLDTVCVMGGLSSKRVCDEADS
jgi:hypothetical protein